jgi:cyclopropane-fatty-acyl-phospholipid synthase
MSQLSRAIEISDLWLLDMENLRLHYAKTLAHWHARLQANEIEIKSEYGDQFFRAWDFYLTSCELAFTYRDLTVFQLLLGKKSDAAPITRAYAIEEEQCLKSRRRGHEM